MPEVNVILNAIAALTLCTTTVGIDPSPFGIVRLYLCCAAGLTALLLGLPV